MIKPVAGARAVPQPVASSSAEAASEDFYRRYRSANVQQLVENRRAAGRAQPAGGAALRAPSTPSTPPCEAAAHPEHAGYRWPEIPSATADRPTLAEQMRDRHGFKSAPQHSSQPDAHEQSGSAALINAALKSDEARPSLADRVQDRAGRAAPSADQAAAPSIADRMRERFGLSAADPAAAASDPDIILLPAARR